MMRFVEFIMAAWLLLYLFRGVQRWLLALEAEMRRARAQQQRPFTGDEAPPQKPDAPPLPSAWQTLGLQPGASHEQIRAAYQKLIRQYHPDLVAHLGPELQVVAERRTKEITEAFTTLKRQGHVS